MFIIFHIAQRMRGRFALSLILVGMVYVFTGALTRDSAYAQGASTEYKFKAVYLFNFLQFVEWPQTAFANDSSPLVIGVVGRDPFGNVLDQTVRNERINGRAVVIRRFNRSDPVEGIHLLFIPRTERMRIREILENINSMSTLTVGEVPDFIASGGDLNLFIDNGKLLFEMNENTVRNTDYKLSSRLLRLAKKPGNKEQ